MEVSELEGVVSFTLCRVSHSTMREGVLFIVIDLLCVMELSGGMSNRSSMSISRLSFWGGLGVVLSGLGP